jgi:hypothetical protein
MRECNQCFQTTMVAPKERSYLVWPPRSDQKWPSRLCLTLYFPLCSDASGAAGYFVNSDGGTILALNDGFKKVIRVNSNGLYIDQAPFAVSPSNDPTTATVLNELARLNAAGNPVPARAGDSGGEIGIVVSGSGTASTWPQSVIAGMGWRAACSTIPRLGPTKFK